MTKKIYALLVGITEYNPSLTLENDTVVFPQLNGCVKDAQKMRSFLETNAGMAELHVQELYNREATKERVCDAFLTHLGKAGDGDTAIFYFSGHGTQEVADPCWTSETDGKLESFVCYYDKENREDFLLADKELRYLISRVSVNSPTLTVIIDCCHSGDMTRNAAIVKANYDLPVEKRSKSGYVFKQRKWGHFIFQESFKAGDVKEKGVHVLLPEGPHIVFSASESDESAYEINEGGIFTSHLITVLQLTRGYISNQLLYDRLALRMKYGYLQKPKVYTPSHSAAWRENSFQNVIPLSSKGGAAAWYTQKGWMLNRGELNGLYKGMDDITLIDGDDPSLPIKASVITVDIDHAVLQVPTGTDPDKSYYADLDYLSRKAIRLYLSMEDIVPSDFHNVINLLDTLPAHVLEIVSQESDANFVLWHLNGLLYLTYPHHPYRPISEVVPLLNFREITKQIEHLSSWQFVYRLSKPLPASAVIKNLLQLEYGLGESEYQPLPVEENASIKIDNWEAKQDDFITTLRMKVTNRSTQNMYVTLLYLDINFSSDTILLEPSPYLLEAGNSVELNVDGDTQLSVEFYTQALYYNYERYTERFKLIVSDKPFEVYPLVLEALTSPPLPGEGTPMGVARSKGGIARTKPFEGFFIINLDIVMINPSHNTLPAEHLTAMLEDKITSPFAEGLYFTTEPNGETDQELTGDLVLRPEITVIANAPGEQGIRQKGIVIDVANSWDRWKRNKYYEEIARRFPGRTKIVSEGDSWFQHPLVYDTIDHLSKVYAIKCVAAAADTLSNYISREKKRGDYFLDVLIREKPAFFLISGGGNDILGSQFRQFLLNKPYDKGLRGNPDGSQFLNDLFRIQINKLMDIYQVIFQLVKNNLPEMKTIVHGYDYPVHLNNRDKGWLGRYMIEKGISEPADRQTVIRYILDEFNKGLSAVAAEYPTTVNYLDLRGTVLYKEGEIDEWYDEIHPNLYGFQSVGLKFIKMIEELKLHDLGQPTV
jgi:hypothetical protein